MKKSMLALLLAALVCIPGCGRGERETREINGKTYELTFSDDFDGTKLDPKKWELCPEWQRQDVGGYWDDGMTEVKDGRLILSAGLREDGTPVSGAVRSKGKFAQCRGYFEASVQLQKASGFWGAFWLMDPGMKDEDGRGAEDGAEIDVMESFDVFSGRINHAIHWDGYGAHHKSVSQEVCDPALYEGFHLYALEWTEEEYIFFVDGKETFRTKSPGMCENALYLKLTTEFGAWASPILKEQLPDCMVVDYVRAYSLVP